MIFVIINIYFSSSLASERWNVNNMCFSRCKCNSSNIINPNISSNIIRPNISSNTKSIQKNVSSSYLMYRPIGNCTKEDYNALSKLELFVKNFFLKNIPKNDTTSSLDVKKTDLINLKSYIEGFKNKIFEYEKVKLITIEDSESLKIDISYKNKNIIKVARNNIFNLFRKLKKIANEHLRTIKLNILDSNIPFEYKEMYCNGIELIIKAISFLIIRTYSEHITIRYDYIINRYRSYEKNFEMVIDKIPIIDFLQNLEDIILVNSNLTNVEKKSIKFYSDLAKKGFNEYVEQKDYIIDKLKFQTKKIILAIEESKQMTITNLKKQSLEKL